MCVSGPFLCIFMSFFSSFIFCSALCRSGGRWFSRPSLPFSILPTLHTNLPSFFCCPLPPPAPLPSTLLSSSSPLPSSSPLLSSYVDEIRWFLLGEASVHPSAAPSRACPTPSNQVINKPANSHSPSISCCLFSTSAVLYVRPCPHAAPCELTASPTHWRAHLTFPFIFQKKGACHRVFWTEVLMALKGTPPCWKSDNKTRFNCELSS